MIRLAADGGWHARLEHAVTTADGTQRFVDVLLERPATAEVLVVEVVNLFADVGADLRGLDRKIEAVRLLRPNRRVAGLLIVRATARNRTVVGGLVNLFAARFGWGQPGCAASGP